MSALIYLVVVDGLCFEFNCVILKGNYYLTARQIYMRERKSTHYSFIMCDMFHYLSPHGIDLPLHVKMQYLQM